MKKVSIVIPLFNTEKWIGAMIESILNQSYKLWELIIVDDGSSDNSLGVAQSYSDDRITVLKRERLPKGAPTCRNIGIEHSSGDYVVLIDSDDILLPDAIADRVSMMESHPEADFGIAGAKAFKQGESIEEALKKDRYVYGDFKGDPLSSLLKSRYPFIVCTNIYRKSSLLKYGITWDENVKAFQDFNFNFSSLNKGLKYVVEEDLKVDYLYRVNHSTTNITHDFLSEEKFSSGLYLIEKTINALEKRSDSKQRKNEFLGFVLNYYLRLVKAYDTDKEKRMLNFCENYYNPYVLFRMRLLSSLSKLIPTFKYKMDVLRLMVLFFFGIKIN